MSSDHRVRVGSGSGSGSASARLRDAAAAGAHHFRPVWFRNNSRSPSSRCTAPSPSMMRHSRAADHGREDRGRQGSSSGAAPNKVSEHD